MKKLLITFPCYNEELVLEKSIAEVIKYAENNLSSLNWVILILDNASRDRTAILAERLKGQYPGKISTDQVLTPGRGAALREGWGRYPDYDIYAYMDVDLATDLKDFKLLVDKVAEGYDFVTGSRYLPTSNTKRSWKRLFLSRIYNILLHLILSVSFKDAQCGFKAFSHRLVAELIPLAKDNGWFWDTELMILACRRSYKVLEIPVSWREVRDELRRSTVSPWTESVRQLKNIYVMHRRLVKGNYGSGSV